MTRQDTSQQIRDIYKLDRQLELIVNQIHSELSLETQQLLDLYDSEMVNSSLGKATRIKQLKILLSLSRKINKNWNDVTALDVSNLVRDVMNEYGDVNGDETESSRDFKKILKLFFRWHKLGSRDFSEVGDPPETKRIKLRKPKDKLTRENLLTEEDRAKLLHACGENLRDKAFLDVHFEAGTRPGKLLSLQIKHVEFDDNGAKIFVDGKTGARPIRLVSSTPNLSAWIDSHPFKENLDAPLWILLASNNYGNPMTYASAKEMLARRCKIANISKKVNLKLFRHSEATKTAKFLTDSEMRKRHGWSNSSNMTSKYVHLNDSDVDQKILSHYGIKPKEDFSVNMPKICKICQIPNASDSTICNKCGKPLDLKTALELETKQQQKLETIEKALQDNDDIKQNVTKILKYLNLN